MTALENVLVGLHHDFSSTVADAILRTPRRGREETKARARAMAILTFMGLAPFANTEARNLPYGNQRMLEIARALALDPRLLLLDEPAAGGAAQKAHRQAKPRRPTISAAPISRASSSSAAASIVTP